MYINQVFISTAVAEKVKKVLISRGCPSENRILILSPKDQEIKQGNIIIPGQVKEGIPRKGVVIMSGNIDDRYRSYERDHLIDTGRIITYGLYAGKELDFPTSIFKEVGIEVDLDQNKFTVLDINEIIYSEVNQL